MVMGSCMKQLHRAHSQQLWLHRESLLSLGVWSGDTSLISLQMRKLRLGEAEGQGGGKCHIQDCQSDNVSDEFRHHTVHPGAQKRR